MGDILESANDLELMSVSDDENDPNISGQISARNQNNSLIEVSDVITRYYYTSKIDSSLNSHSLTDDDACDGYEKKKEQVDVSDDEDEGDSNAVCSPLYAADFLDTEFVVGKDEMNTERISPRFNSEFEEDASNSPSFRTSVVYGKPRLKKIGPKSLLIKPRRTRVYKSLKVPGPRKIISDMYGVRTISYDLPEPEQPCASGVEGVKTTTLSGSDSDASEPPSPSQCVKTTRSFKPEYRDLANLRQPLLSDASSSPSSRSDSSSSTSRSTGSSSSSSSSSCSCSSCSRNKKA